MVSQGPNPADRFPGDRTWVSSFQGFRFQVGSCQCSNLKLWSILVQAHTLSSTSMISWHWWSRRRFIGQMDFFAPTWTDSDPSRSAKVFGIRYLVQSQWTHSLRLLICILGPHGATTCLSWNSAIAWVARGHYLQSSMTKVQSTLVRSIPTAEWPWALTLARKGLLTVHRMGGV